MKLILISIPGFHSGSPPIRARIRFASSRSYRRHMLPLSLPWKQASGFPSRQRIPRDFRKLISSLFDVFLVFDMQFSWCFSDLLQGHPLLQFPAGPSHLLKVNCGSRLLFHTVSSIVPSADRVLTIVFGMGTGVSPGRIATANIAAHGS